ncbi:hypothetical protein [Kineococcus sp. NPDC059986]|uniref:Acb2/Tad1 domain-containing protein n=1 Tax=Kineococcus sp. NPDC059986 TaxID=3155538 RepID=UPI00344FFF15
MSPLDIDHRFDYHKPDPVRVVQHSQVRSVLWAAARDLNENLPEGREKSTAITKLEEAMFWANAAIARS